MNLVISGKNIDITEGLRAAVEEKIGKLERVFRMIQQKFMLH